MSSDKLGSIDSRAGFESAVRNALALARDAGARDMTLVDPGFDDWPLDERATIDTLGAWAASSRKLLLMAHAFDNLARRAPRFAEWRRQWSHVVHCRADAELQAEQVPTLLLVPGVVCVQLHDRTRFRGVVSERPVDQAEIRDRIEALLQRSTEAFPVTTLGL